MRIQSPRFDNTFSFKVASPARSSLCVAGLVSAGFFVNSGHIQQFRSRPSPLGHGRVSQSTPTTLVYSRTRAYLDPASCRGVSHGEVELSLTRTSLHATASGFKARRLRATREVSKAKVVPRVADREDVRETGTMDGTSRQRRCPVCVVRTGACSTAERRSTRLVPRPVADGRRR